MASSERSQPPGRGWRRLRERLKARLRRAWRPLLFAGIVIGFLMGRAQPFSPAAPFGIAFYTAVRAAGFGHLAALPAAAALLAGAALVQPSATFATTAAAVGLVHVLAGLARASGQHSALAAAVVAAAVAAGQGLFQDPAAGAVQLTFWATLTGVLALLFTLAVADAAQGRQPGSGAPELPIPAVILLASALTGLQDLTLWGRLPLHGVFAGLAVLLCAHAGGMGWGAAAGAVIGMSSFLAVLAGPPGAGMVLRAPLPDSQAMAYVVAGFLGGAFRDLKKPGVGLAYALGFLAYSMATQGQGAVLEAMALSAAAATVLFWLVPSQWVEHLARALDGERREEPEPAAQPPVDEAVREARERLLAVAQALREVQRTYAQVAAVGSPPEAALERRLRALTEQVCRSCAMRAQCWEKDVEETRRLMDGLWQQIEQEGPLPLAPLPGALEERCIHPAQVAVTLNHLHDLERTDRALARRLEEGRAVAGEHIQSVARMLDRMAEEIASGAGPARGMPAVFKVAAAVARLPKRGSHVSGDSALAVPLSGGRFLLALSDGMGVGREAAVQSGECVRLLQQLLDAGFSAEVAVKTVNSVLLLRGPGDAFATLDVALVDLATGQAEFVKVGAAPTFIRRGADVTLVRIPAPPAGVVTDVAVEPESRLLNAGDLVVMVSDGILEAARDQADKERWLLELLSREPGTDPEEVAERVLAEALTLAPVPEDDLTVVAARVALVDGADGPPRPKPSGEWAPALTAPRGGSGGVPPKRQPKR